MMLFTYSLSLSVSFQSVICSLIWRTTTAVLCNCTIPLKFVKVFISCLTQKTHPITITKTGQLPMFTELVVLYSENRVKHMNVRCGYTAEFLTVM